MIARDHDSDIDRGSASRNRKAAGVAGHRSPLLVRMMRLPHRAHAAREGFATAGWVGAVALSKPLTKYLSNGATNPIHARYYCGGNNLPKVRIRAHPPPAAPPFAASKPGSFGAGSTLQTHSAAKLNNAKRRWVKSGQCNPPVPICLCRPCKGSGAGAILGRQLRRPYLSSIRDNVCSNSAISDLTFCTVTWSGI